MVHQITVVCLVNGLKAPDRLDLHRQPQWNYSTSSGFHPSGGAAAAACVSSFNSTLVRLKRDIDFPLLAVHLLFQFHTGAIKTQYGWNKLKEVV
mgnify:CR=1 FL=1